MGQVVGVVDGAAARCASIQKALPAVWSVCMALPWRGPGSFVVYHWRALVMSAGSNPPQATVTADSFTLGGTCAAYTGILS